MTSPLDKLIIESLNELHTLIRKSMDGYENFGKQMLLFGVILNQIILTFFKRTKQSITEYNY